MRFYLDLYFCVYAHTHIGTMLMIGEGWSTSPMKAG